MRRGEVLIPLYLWASVSLLLHLGFFEGTTTLTKGLRAPPLPMGPAPLAASEVEFDFAPTPPRPEAPAAAERPERRPQPEARRRPEERRPEPTPRAQTLTPPPTPVPAQTRPAPPQTVRVPVAQYVHQTNPNEEVRPQDPHFLAQANRNVEEETVAPVRNLNRDDPDPTVGRSRERDTTQGPGSARRDVSADSENRAGRDDTPPHENPHPRHEPRRPNTPDSARPAAAATRGGAPGPRGEQGRAGRPGTTGDPAPVPTVNGAGDVAVTAGGEGHGGDGGDNGRQGRAGGGGDVGIRGVGARRAMAALTPSYTTFAAVYGEQELEHMRADARQRRSDARGSYADDWAQTRAAIENFTPRVRVGNQTALRTAASPFAAYITAMHRRIHRLFADGFLASLDGASRSSPMNDENLHTTLEIVLERDGSIHRVGLIRSSGVLPFDVAAINSVRRSQPYGEAPGAIVSGDGKVYLHWGFYRGHRQCGTFNVEPFILPEGARPPGPTAPGPRRESLPMPGEVGETETSPRRPRA
ncbi:MAG: TonB C-terminal domain-containing protein [Polyangiales bacterium]